MSERAELVTQLTDARARTLALVEDLSDAQLDVPRLEIVNPFLWELGHVAWFQEFWALRQLAGEAPTRDDGDWLYDSAKVAHATRWDLTLPSRRETLAYMGTVLERVLERLEAVALNERERYFHQLVVFHEDMHDEAFAYMRQTLGLPAPRHVSAVELIEVPSAGDSEFAGGTFELGARPTDGFVFDNEKWAHAVELAPFRLARAAVTQQEFAAFVDERGYARRELWSDAGWAWREKDRAEHPVYWRRDRDGWSRREFDAWIAFEPHRPVLHVNWFEADAFCRWSERRLPSEAEWEFAANAGLARSDVWEWTASTFSPYPGFVRDPYAEYSEPWFGTHKVLRGRSFATPARLVRNTWRNFYPPERRDIFAGFRTAAS